MESSIAAFLTRQLARELLPTIERCTDACTFCAGGSLDLSRPHVALTRVMLSMWCGMLTHDRMLPSGCLLLSVA